MPDDQAREKSDLLATFGAEANRPYQCDNLAALRRVCDRHGVWLHVGPDQLALFSGETGMDHYSIAVDGYDGTTVRKTLHKRRSELRFNRNYGSYRFWDPSGHRIEITEPEEDA